MFYWALSSLAAVWYCLFVLKYLKGWELLFIDSIPEKVSTKNYYSILIAARNEEENIRSCIDDLLAQNFPEDRFEIIVIDDFSEDATAEIVKSTYCSAQQTMAFCQIKKEQLATVSKNREAIGYWQQMPIVADQMGGYVLLIA